MKNILNFFHEFFFNFKKKTIFFQNVDKKSKNPSSFALGFVNLALLRASKNMFKHRPCYVKPTVVVIGRVVGRVVV